MGKLYPTIYVLIVAIGFGSFLYGASLWGRDDRPDDEPVWRRIANRCGFFAVLFQAVAFITIFWAPDYLLEAYQHLMIPALIGALVCLFVTRGPARWWLIASSILLSAAFIFLPPLDI
jgi:hypothetical protein